MNRALTSTSRGFLLGGFLLYLQFIVSGTISYLLKDSLVQKSPDLIYAIAGVLLAIGGGSLALGLLMLITTLTVVWPVSLFVDRFTLSNTEYALLGGFLGTSICYTILRVSGLDLLLEGHFRIFPLTSALVTGSFTGFHLARIQSEPMAEQSVVPNP